MALLKSKSATGGPSWRIEYWRPYGSRIAAVCAELFFFVVAGEEDLAVLVEAVDQAFDGVGRRR